MKKVSDMNKLYFLLIILLVGCSTLSYQDRVRSWDSHEDVARWMQTNFRWDKGFSKRTPKEVYKYRSGDCLDGTNFAVATLNLINPQYHARPVYITNALGPPHHWVAAFDYNGKLYIMDYSQGYLWAAMRGTHGPYNSLIEYRKFLDTLPIPKFRVAAMLDYRH